MLYLEEAGGCILKAIILAQCHTGRHDEMQDYLQHCNCSSCAPEILLTPAYTYMKTSAYD